MSAYLEQQFSLFQYFMKPWIQHTRGQIYVRTFISLQKPAHLESTAMQRTLARTVSVHPCWYVREDYRCAVVQFYHVIYLNTCTPMVSPQCHMHGGGQQLECYQF